MELKSLALMLPEEPTDFGWNQQGMDAARAVLAAAGRTDQPDVGKELFPHMQYAATALPATKPAPVKRIIRRRVYP